MADPTRYAIVGYVDAAAAPVGGAELTTRRGDTTTRSVVSVPPLVARAASEGYGRLIRRTLTSPSAITMATTTITAMSVRRFTFFWFSARRTCWWAVLTGAPPLTAA